MDLPFGSVRVENTTKKVHGKTTNPKKYRLELSILVDIII